MTLLDRMIEALRRSAVINRTVQALPAVILIILALAVIAVRHPQRLDPSRILAAPSIDEELAELPDGTNDKKEALL